MILIVFNDGGSVLVLDSVAKLSVIKNEIYAFANINGKEDSYNALKLAEYESEKEARQRFRQALESISYGKKVIYL